MFKQKWLEFNNLNIVQQYIFILLCKKLSEKFYYTLKYLFLDTIRELLNFILTKMSILVWYRVIKNISGCHYQD